MIFSRRFFAICTVVVAVALVGLFLLRARNAHEPARHLVINEAARTLLYLPIYYAAEQGYFKDEGLDVDIVTGGTATNAVSAMISGDADVALADPMYAPISQAHGSDVVVIAQVVGRIALWAVARPGAPDQFDAADLKGSSIITQPQPMTGYTYTVFRLRDIGLDLSQVSIIQAKPGTDIATYAGQPSVPYLVGIEPSVSILEKQGAKVIYSWPHAIGDRVFSALLVKKDKLEKKGNDLSGLTRALQRSLTDLHGRDPHVLASAKRYFPSLSEEVLRRAIERLAADEVFPDSVIIPRASWDGAVAVRKALGDIKGEARYDQNVDKAFAEKAIKR